MLTISLPLLAGLAGCDLLNDFRGSAPLPEKIQGQWEVHQIETEGGIIAAEDAIAQQYPRCLWGRMTWTFDAGHVALAYDVLCPAAAGEYYGCEVSARVPAVWDEQAGAWSVEHPAYARSRTVGRGDEAISVPTSCQVAIQPGTYQLVRVRNQDWRWEMRSPDRMSVYRLRLPSSQRPDFVAAIAAAPPPPPPPEPTPEAEGSEGVQ
jgi:hypothetical protein